jgi:hypothetical protein
MAALGCRKEERKVQWRSSDPAKQRLAIEFWLCENPAAGQRLKCNVDGIFFERRRRRAPTISALKSACQLNRKAG